MRKTACCLLGLSLLGCSNDYVPAPEAQAEHIFNSACLECHKPANNTSIFRLKPENANANYIANKIQKGSFLMPAFSKFSEQDLAKLSTYLLEHSETLE